jgi:hypothetical protein
MTSENPTFLEELEWKPFDEIEKRGWVICLTPYGDSYSFGLIFFDDKGKSQISSGAVLRARYAATIKLPDALIQKIIGQ